MYILYIYIYTYYIYTHNDICKIEGLGSFFREIAASQHFESGILADSLRSPNCTLWETYKKRWKMAIFNRKAWENHGKMVIYMESPAIFNG